MSKRAFFSPAWLACLGVAWLALPALAAPTKVFVVVQNTQGEVLKDSIVVLKGQPLATKPEAASPAVFVTENVVVEFGITVAGFPMASVGMALPANDGLVNLLVTLDGDRASIEAVDSSPTGSIGEAMHDAYNNRSQDGPISSRIAITPYSGPIHVGAGQTAGPAGCDAGTILTHQTAPGTFDELSSVACGVGGSHTVENAYAQSFVIPAGLTDALSCVDFVTSQQTVGIYTVTVNIYQDTNGGVPDVASLVLLGSATADIPIDNIGITSTVDFSGQGISLPAGASMVFEIFAPDRDAAVGGDGGQFRVGSSGLTADGPSYILSAACGITDHLDTGAIGFPESQWMYNVGFGAGAPPATGDTCADCVSVDASGAAGDTSTGTASGLNPSCGASSGNDDWYCYTAPATGSVTFDTCGSGFDTVISAFTGCATEIACNDDSCGLQSSVTVAVTEGAVYNIRVGGFSTAAGAYVLNVTEDFPVDTGNTCGGCTAVTASGAVGDTSGNTADGPFPSCGASSGNDAWFCYTAPDTGSVTFDTCGSGFDTVIAGFSDCVGTELACNDDSCGLQSSITLAVTAGEVINIRVGGFSTGSGAYVLNVTEDFGPPAGCGAACTAAAILTNNATACVFDNASSVACGVGGSHTVINQYAQSFNLGIGGTAGTAQTVSCVDVGVSANDDGGDGTGDGGDYTIGVNIYHDTNGGAPNDAAGDLTLICGTTVLVPAGMAGAMVTASFAPGCTLPVDAVLVLEIDAPTRDVALGGDGGNFRMGSSGVATDGPSYLKSVDCGLTDYLDVGAIGFPTSQWVQNLGLDGGPPPPDGCGSAGTGSCTDPAGTGSPFCDNLACCEAVCAFDSFCCDVEWDGICAGETAGIPACEAPGGCTPGAGDEPGDCLCIAEGDTVNGTTADNTGSVDDTSCAFDDTIDEWFCYTATCTGNVTLSTCNQAAYDTTIAVFEEVTGLEVGCNDDGPGCAGFTSLLTFPVTAGTAYNVRISGFGGDAGAYTLTMGACEEPPVGICALNAPGSASCQTFVTDNASQSNDDAFTSADDFTVAASGSISNICWWGAYLPAPLPDAFILTYYADDTGIPGAVIGGPFTQGVDLTVAGPIDTGELVAGLAPIWEYTGTHAPVAVTGGSCYWVEIKNTVGGGTNWFWEWSFDGDLLTVTDAGPNGYDQGDRVEGDHDFAWCLNLDTVTPDCPAAPPIPCGQPGGPFPVCGDAAAGACDVANGSPGCDNVDCCCSICSADAFCCDVEWDQICADAAIVLPCILEPQGACCQGAAGCEVLTAGDCAAAGGTYQGDDTVCTPDPCPPVGACCGCPDENACQVLIEADCVAPAEWLGAGTNCDLPPGDSTLVESGTLLMDIPDSGGGPISHDLNMGMNFLVQDVNIGVNITHTWIGDLCITVSHLGTDVVVVQRIGDLALDCTGGCCGCSEDNMAVSLDDGAAVPVDNACPAFGDFIPDFALSAFNGMSSAGVWTITVNDNAGGDTGTLDSWSMTITAPGTADPVCLGVCQICNNGIIEGTETCDPGAADPSDCCDDVTCTFVASGSNCGSGVGICSAQDTCNATGTCEVNHSPNGTLCGNPATECSDQDSCDGNGGCSSNDSPLGTACGNPADMPGNCFTGDACSGGGVCIPGTIVTLCIDDDLCCNRSHGCSDENDNDCEADVPTVSTWGLLVLALLLAAAAKVYFGRRESLV